MDLISNKYMDVLIDFLIAIIPYIYISVETIPYIIANYFDNKITKIITSISNQLTALDTIHIVNIYIAKSSLHNFTVPNIYTKSKLIKLCKCSYPDDPLLRQYFPYLNLYLLLYIFIL